MVKKIVFIAGSVNTKDFLYRQLKEFISEKYILEAYAQEDEIKSYIQCDLLIVSSKEMKDELDKMGIKIEYHSLVVCERSVNFDFIDQVASLPVNEEVLLVNDEKDTAYNAIDDLIELGLSHIKYYPYYPGIAKYKRLKTAITPGESDKAPGCVAKIIDIGPRIISINSMYEIMDKLNLSHRDTTFITKKYMQKIINVSQHISSINNKINTLNGYLNNVIHNLVNGILVYDENGYIKYANEKMKSLLSVDKDLENKNVLNIIDKELFSYMLSKDCFENKTLCIMGVYAKVTKFIAPNGNIVITTDRDEHENPRLQNREYILKGHVAKYDVENIIGSSKVLEETKKTALKLAQTDLTILIEGESGTGKELFASAIHQNSKRKFGPYIAINFSALPDDLIESELFGYEEGAFTGAKKGGKIGLFELADGGTIFLDEIGDVSPKVQTKLLRVLQEKEVMMIGGTTIKKVDVRIIAATNKNLKKMVLDKQFRADLYYRLKIGYIYLPTLRERLNDIGELVNYFIKTRTTADVKVSENVLREFMNYKWLGNIRELESTVQYMLAVRTENLITLADLPDRNFFEEAFCESTSELSIVSDESNCILCCIEKLQNENLSSGREKISDMLIELGYELSASQVRTRLNFLEKQGYIIKKKGRQGTVLTEKGLKLLKGLND